MVYLLNSLETKRKKNSNKMWIKEKIHSSCDLYNLFLNYVISWNRITMTNHLIKLTKQSQLLSTSNKNEWNLNPPVYLQALFNKQSMDYIVWFAYTNSFGKLTFPRLCSNYLKNSFSYSSALLWNSVPENIRKITLIAKFKMQISHIFETDSDSAIL